MLPCRATTGGGARQLDTFLGVLYLVQDYKVYGYVTNTGVRFVLVIDDQDNKDGRFFHYIYKNYSHMYNMYAACLCMALLHASIHVLCQILQIYSYQNCMNMRVLYMQTILNVYIDAYVYIHEGIHARMCVLVCLYDSVEKVQGERRKERGRKRLCLCLHVYICACVHVCVRVYACARKDTHAHTQTHACVY